MVISYLLIALVVAVFIAGVIFLVRKAQGRKAEDLDVPPHRGPTPQSGPDERRG